MEEAPLLINACCFSAEVAYSLLINTPRVVFQRFLNTAHHSMCRTGLTTFYVCALAGTYGFIDQGMISAVQSPLLSRSR